jgi:hypothetical protein
MAESVFESPSQDRLTPAERFLFEKLQAKIHGPPMVAKRLFTEVGPGDVVMGHLERGHLIKVGLAV